MSKLTHVDGAGKLKMIDISGKESSLRSASVEASILLNEETFKMVESNSVAKGDVLNTAKIAGIAAAKKTSELIPLCHQIPLNHVEINFELLTDKNCIKITCHVRAGYSTGVEMEAFCAASIAALTIYDMVKAVQRDVIISDLKLISKKGGKSGEFTRSNI